MTAAQLRTSALNLRARASTEENVERATAWRQEADENEAKAAQMEKAAPPSKK